jgi:hypothetical protein
MTAQPPIRTLIDIVTHAQAGTLREAAIAHADACDQGWSLNDFEIIYLGLLSAEEIDHYDDLSSWVEVTDADDLATFRNGTWDQSPDTDLPSIIVITAPDEGRCQRVARMGGMA